MPTANLVARWRPSVLALVTMTVAVVAFVALSVVCVVIGIQSDPALLLAALWFLVLAVGVGLLERGRVDLYPDRVDLVRWFGFKTRSIDLSDIKDVSPDRSGIYFALNDGSIVSGPATIGQKGLGLDLIHYKNRGDRISAEIMRAVAAALSG